MMVENTSHKWCHNYRWNAYTCWTVDIYGVCLLYFM